MLLQVVRSTFRCSEGIQSLFRMLNPLDQAAPADSPESEEPPYAPKHARLGGVDAGGGEGVQGMAREVGKRPRNELETKRREGQ